MTDESESIGGTYLAAGVGCKARLGILTLLSTTLENDALAMLENEATETDWMVDLGAGLGFGPGGVHRLVIERRRRRLADRAR